MRKNYGLKAWRDRTSSEDRWRCMDRIILYII